MLVRPSYFGTYRSTQAIVVFRHDDTALESWSSYALPVYERHGIGATFFTNTRDLGVSAIDRAKRLMLSGMEVGSHFSRHHSLKHHTDPVVIGKESEGGWGAPMSESQLRLVLQEAVCDIEQWGGARGGMVESCVTPWQEWNDLAQHVVPDYHTSCSNGDPGNGGCPNGPMTYPPNDYMQCQSVVVDAGTSVAEVEALVQKCIDNRLFVQLMFHFIEHDDGTKAPAPAGSTGLSWLDSQLEELCAWCEQQRDANPTKVIFPQMRDATRYMRGLGDYDYQVAQWSLEFALSASFPFLRIKPHVYNAAGEEVLLSSVL